MKHKSPSISDAIRVQQQRIEQLEAALAPFARAAEEISDGCRSTLRIWDGCTEDGQSLHLLNANTEHLLEAKRVLEQKK